MPRLACKRPAEYGETHSAKNIIIATGARARVLPGMEINGKTTLTYHQALELTEAPKSMVVIGAGAIGMEFSFVFNSYGTEVTVVEMLPDVLPLEDADVSKEMEKPAISMELANSPTYT